jgi:hypothetical protein
MTEYFDPDCFVCKILTRYSAMDQFNTLLEKNLPLEELQKNFKKITMEDYELSRTSLYRHKRHQGKIKEDPTPVTTSTEIVDCTSLDENTNPDPILGVFEEKSRRKRGFMKSPSQMLRERDRL